MSPKWSSLTIFFLLFLPAVSAVSCRNKCGLLDVMYPLGTGYGCGDSRFHSSISCTNGNQLEFCTHTGSYPIKSIDYASSIITIIDPRMSTCSAMQTAQTFGLDWDAPFQLSTTSLFVLLDCTSPSTLSYKGNPLCDASNAHICASLYSCPAIVSLGLPLYSPTAFNSCCVYSPVNLGPAHDLNLQSLHCSSYTSIVSFGNTPTDPNSWDYGISLKYSNGLADSYVSNACGDCEKTGGVCGYSPPRNNFVCVCNNGVNTTINCDGQVDFWSSASSSFTGSVWWGLVAALGFISL